MPHKSTAATAPKRAAKAASPIPAVAPLPSSWRARAWPPSVFPNEQRPADYIVRRYKEQLERCGALARVGRDLIVIGQGYAVFLAQNMDRVSGYVAGPQQAAARAQEATQRAAGDQTGG